MENYHIVNLLKPLRTLKSTLLKKKQELLSVNLIETILEESVLMNSLEELEVK